MIDIDHETKSAYSDNLGIPGEAAALQDPDMDQIDVKLASPNVTGMFERLLCYTNANLTFSLQCISMSIKSNSNGK